MTNRRNVFPQSLHTKFPNWLSILTFSFDLMLGFCFSFKLPVAALFCDVVPCRGLCHRRCDAKFAGQLNTYLLGKFGLKYKF